MARQVKKYKGLEDELKAIVEQAKKDVQASVEFAENSPLPTSMEDLMSNVYVGDN